MKVMTFLVRYKPGSFAFFHKSPRPFRSLLHFITFSLYRFLFDPEMKVCLFIIILNNHETIIIHIHVVRYR